MIVGLAVAAAMAAYVKIARKLFGLTKHHDGVLAGALLALLILRATGSL